MKKNNILIGNITGNWNRITTDLYSRFAKHLPSTPLVQINNPSVPLYIGKDETFEKICSMAKHLKTIGVTHVMIACNAFHMRRIEFMWETGLFMFDMCGAVQKTAINKQFKKVGIISTAETVAGGLYENEEYELLVPLPEEQKILTRLIFEKTLGNPLEIVQIIRSLANRGAECIIIGCTDLGAMLLPEAREIIPVLDPMNELINLAVKEINHNSLIKKEEFYNSAGDFVGWVKKDASHSIFTIASEGYGRPQIACDAMVGIDGNFLSVVQNINTGVVEREGIWSDEANKRFMKLYGPSSNDSYRFDLWLETKFK